MGPARKPVDLPPSPLLSIVGNGPGRFEGRKLGVLVTGDAPADLIAGLLGAVTDAGGMREIIAPMIAGVKLDDGSTLPAPQKIDGGPSVLYDAVAVIVSDEGARKLRKDAPSRHFMADAFAHCKFIAFNTSALPLLEEAGVELDDGRLNLSESGAAAIIDKLDDLRFWEREVRTDSDGK